MSWEAGYPTELPYTSSYYVEHAPAHMRLAALLTSTQTPRVDRPFRFLELGCGTGSSVITMAASNPDSECVGIDYAPAQIAAGQAIIDEGRIDNAILLEADFLELAKGAADELGQFDFIVCHGVYTWVAPEIRHAIVSLLQQVAAPGALVFMGYNSLPGWSGAYGLQKMIRMLASQERGDIDERVRAAIVKTKAMADAGLQGVALAHLPSSLIENLDKPEEMSRVMLRYVAHEYLSEHWSPMFRDDLSRDLAAAKLAYAGSSHLLDAFPETLANPQQRDMIESFPKEFSRQFYEYVAPPRFRRDIFVKGRMPITDRQRADALKDTTLILARSREDFEYEVAVQIGKAEIPRPSYEPLVEALEERPRTIGDLVELSREQGSDLSPEEIAGMLVTSGQVLPARQSSIGSVAGIRQANHALIKFALEDPSAHHLSLASPLLGSGLPTETANMVLYDILTKALDKDEEPDEEHMALQLIDSVHRRGEQFTENGEAITDPERNRFVADTAIDRAKNVLMKRWSSFGMV